MGRSRPASPPQSLSSTFPRRDLARAFPARPDVDRPLALGVRRVGDRLRRVVLQPARAPSGRRGSRAVTSFCARWPCVAPNVETAVVVTGFVTVVLSARRRHERQGEHRDGNEKPQRRKDQSLLPRKLTGMISAIAIACDTVLPPAEPVEEDEEPQLVHGERDQRDDEGYRSSLDRRSRPSGSRTSSAGSTSSCSRLRSRTR